MAEPLAAQPAATPQPAVRRVAVVFNPATSPDDAPERKRDLQAALNAAGVEVVVWLETTKQEAGQGLTRQAVEQGVDLVLAAGGDGTVMACVTGLAASGVPLAVLPAGTGNLLALNLDLPSDLDDAVDVALHGDRRQLDVGALDGGADRFVIMSGLGFDAAMLRDANPTLKTRIGALAYVLSGLRQLRRRPARFRIRLDDQPPITRVGQGLLIVNLGACRAGSRWCPTPSPTMACWTSRSLGPARRSTGYGWPPRCCCAASVSPSSNGRPGRRWSCSAPDASRSTATGPSRSSGTATQPAAPAGW